MNTETKSIGCYKRLQIASHFVPRGRNDELIGNVMKQGA
jgi:hypothetical protein